MYGKIKINKMRMKFKKLIMLKILLIKWMIIL